MQTLSCRSLCLSLALIANASHSGAQSEPGYDVLIQQGNTQLQAGSTDQALTSGEAAIKIRADRWEGYALAGSALMNLKRYEDSADALSKAIERAPDSNQPALRDLRRQCLIAESGYPSVANSSASGTTRQTEIVLWKSIENSHNAADFQSYLDQSKYSRPAEYARANFTRATGYCAALRSLGYIDWRLPTAVEFMRIYHFAADSARVQLDGGLAGNEEILRFLGFWTSTRGDKEGEHILVFEGKSVSSRNNDGDGRVGGWFAGHPWNGAIVCVRDQKNAEHP